MSPKTIQKAGGVRLIIRERQYPAELATTIAAETGARVVDVPIMTGGDPEARDYIRFIDFIVKRLVAAAKEER